MLDINLVREKPGLVKESQKKRGLSEKEVDIILVLDEKWRKLKQEVDELRAERNKISSKINESKKQGKKVDDLIKKAKELPEEIKNKENELTKVEEERMTVLENIPNIVDKSVPVGDATKNKVTKVFCKPKKLKFTPKGHEDLLINLDQLDIERAAKVSGSRFYYLKKDLVKLNYAIINFILDL